MKFKHLSTLLLFAIAGYSASFARGSMKVNMADAGQSRDFPLTTDLKMTFDTAGGNMLVNYAPGGSANFSLKAVKSITFSADPSGVEDVADMTQPIQLLRNPVESVLQFSAQPPTPCTLSVYNLQGSLILKADNWQGQDADVSSLTSGMYIIHFNNNSIKFIKK